MSVRNTAHALVTESRLRDIRDRSDGDTEVAHADADDALCSLLRVLGYHEVVELWSAIPKWYA